MGGENYERKKVGFTTKRCSVGVWGCELKSIVQHLLRLLVVLLVISLRSFLWGTTAHPPALGQNIFFQLLFKRKSCVTRAQKKEYHLYLLLYLATKVFSCADGFYLLENEFDSM